MPNRIKVFLVDDDDDDRLLFRDSIHVAKLQTELTLFNTGKDLLKHLHSNASALPDIIFLDINMPELNGIECLKEIRLETKFVNIIIVMFTTSNNHLDVSESFAAGANLYVSKPTSFNDQVKVIKEIISRDFKEFLNPTLENFLLYAGFRIAK